MSAEFVRKQLMQSTPISDLIFRMGVAGLIGAGFERAIDLSASAAAIAAGGSIAAAIPELLNSESSIRRYVSAHKRLVSDYRSSMSRCLGRCANADHLRQFRESFAQSATCPVVPQSQFDFDDSFDVPTKVLVGDLQDVRSRENFCKYRWSCLVNDTTSLLTIRRLRQLGLNIERCPVAADGVTFVRNLGTQWSPDVFVSADEDIVHFGSHLRNQYSWLGPFDYARNWVVVPRGRAAVRRIVYLRGSSAETHIKKGSTALNAVKANCDHGHAEIIPIDSAEFRQTHGERSGDIGLISWDPLISDDGPFVRFGQPFDSSHSIYVANWLVPQEQCLLFSAIVAAQRHIVESSVPSIISTIFDLDYVSGFRGITEL